MPYRDGRRHSPRKSQYYCSEISVLLILDFSTTDIGFQYYCFSISVVLTFSSLHSAGKSAGISKPSSMAFRLSKSSRGARSFST